MKSLVSTIFALSIYKCSALSGTGNILQGLDVAVVGAGPSGLLAAHRLLSSGCSHVTLYETRGDPRVLENIRDDRAYALGVGIRGRTAIKSVDDELWQLVKSCGFPCDKFLLHPTPTFQLCLRDEAATMKASVQPGQEPSILLFQTDLCSVMLDELERRYKDSGRIKVMFNSKVESTKLVSNEGNESKIGTQLFDLVIGCDGVRSKIRASMEELMSDEMKTTVKELPGVAKVITVPLLMTDNATLDNDSVHLIFPKGPKAGSVTAFVEPTLKGSCILFAGKYNADNEDDSPQLLAPGKAFSNDQVKEFCSDIRESFPLLAEQLSDDVVVSILKQTGFSSATVTTNIYHCAQIAICGDAAHATGGVSGQGCNSALVDASVLVDCLEEAFSRNSSNGQSKSALVKEALLSYSQSQVPEGSALYELAIGPDSGTSVGKRILSTLSALFDFIFKDKTTIQRILGTSLKPFSDIRRERDIFFDNRYPEKNEYDAQLKRLHENVLRKVDPTLEKVALHVKSN